VTLMAGGAAVRTQVQVPVEVGGRRRIALPVLQEGACRFCGEPIIRINGNDWIHTARARGQPCAHAARPSTNSAASVATSSKEEEVTHA